MASSESLKAVGNSDGDLTTSGILKVLATGLTNAPARVEPSGTTLPSSVENSQQTDILNSTLKSLLDLTTQSLTTESIQDPMQADTTTFSPVVTSHVADDVMGGLDDVYTVVVTTEAPGFVLTPMLKWFIATGTIIVLVIILIIINCCLNYKEQLQKTMKDMKRYAAEEKRVRREQNKIDMEEDKHHDRQTHVFWTWIARGKKSPSQPKKQYSRC